MYKFEGFSSVEPTSSNVADFGSLTDFEQSQKLGDQLVHHQWCELPRYQSEELITGDILHITSHSKFHYETLSLKDGNSFYVADDSFSLNDKNGKILDEGKNLAPANSNFEIYKYENGAIVIIEKTTGIGDLCNADGSVVRFTKSHISAVTRDGVTDDRSTPDSRLQPWWPFPGKSKTGLDFKPQSDAKRIKQ
jgi:hypothetical protein